VGVQPARPRAKRLSTLQCYVLFYVASLERNPDPRENAGEPSTPTADHSACKRTPIAQAPAPSKGDGPRTYVESHSSHANQSGSDGHGRPQRKLASATGAEQIALVRKRAADDLSGGTFHVR
jgi:hypothetical protein